MISLSLPLCAALAFAPVDSSPAVQRPSVAPTQPQAGEPAIAPATIESEAAVAEPAGGEPAPAPAEPGAEAGPEEGLPSYDSTPAPPAPAVVTEPEAEPEGGLPSYDSSPTAPASDSGDLPNVDAWGVPVVVEPVDNSPPKGVGFYAGAGSLFGVMITKQLIMGLTCADVYCGWRGNADRILAFGTIGLAGGGGWFDGRRRAYFDLKEDKQLGSLTKRRATGWTLFSLGMVGLITDMVLYHVCYDGARGPYQQLEGFSYTCSPVASVVTMDFSTVFASLGLGMGLSAESQRRHRETNKFDLSVAPWGGAGQRGMQAGVSVAGRF